jgi:hypothetical protein
LGVNCDGSSLRLTRPAGKDCRQLILNFADRLNLQIAKPGGFGPDTLSYFALNLLPDRVSVAFVERNPRLVRRILALFNVLGYPLARMSGYASDGTDADTPAREWMTKWGVTWRLSLVNQVGRERLLRIPGQWLVLEPQFSADGKAALPEQLQMECLRYTLVMGAIRFGSLTNPLTEEEGSGRSPIPANC